MLIVISIMPSDYSNTVVYKIHCKDAAILDTYVGHTTNFQLRQMQHKCASNNLNKQLKLYNTIRANGGWSNWEMVELNRYNCKDFTEARKKEQIHYEELNPSLNSVAPSLEINTQKFACEHCHYATSRKSQYDRHLMTTKHKGEGNQQMKEHVPQKIQCICGMDFYSRTTHWRHIKTCQTVDKKAELKVQHKENKDKPEVSDKELIFLLVKQNAVLLDIIKAGRNNMY